jgi:hypothetical protein
VSDLLAIRHKDIAVAEKMAEYSLVPVINAMTDGNHPCEILSDLYAPSKPRQDLWRDKFLFCGGRGNIALTWKEAACCDKEKRREIILCKRVEFWLNFQKPSIEGILFGATCWGQFGI